MKTKSLLLFITFIGIALLSFNSFDQDEWVVPDKYEKMKNPTDPAEDLDIGKQLYSKHC